MSDAPPIYIITKAEREQASYQTFRELDPWLVTHDDERAERLRKELGTDRVLSSGIPPGPRGKIEQQRWLFEHHVTPDHWVIVADDNIRGLMGIPAGERDRWDGSAPSPSFNRALRSTLDVSAWVPTIHDTLRRADTFGARLVGFASSPNPLSRYTRWGTCSFVWGKLMVWRVDPLYPWDLSITVMDDWAHTAVHLVRYGSVLVDYFTHMDGSRYERGGLGTFHDRSPLREHDIGYLIHRYPGLFAERRKRSGELDVRMVRNRSNFAAWRERYLAMQRSGAFA